MYKKESAVRTYVLYVFKLNFIKRVCIWNAVQIYYFHKHEGEEQNNSNWDREYKDKKLWNVCKEIIDREYDGNNIGLQLRVWKIPEFGL